MACQAPICWSKYTTIVIAEKEIPLILLTKKCILQFTVLTGPYKTTLIASLHLQLRSATIDDAAIDNAAKKCLLRHRKTCQLKNCKNLAFSPLPSPKIATSLSHSPLPVLPIFELHGQIRHNGAV